MTSVAPVAFVSTTLDLLELPAFIAERAGGAIYSLAPSPSPASPSPSPSPSPPVPYYRLTPTVYAWIHQRLWTLDARAVRTNDAKLTAALAEAAGKLAVLDEWVAGRPEEFPAAAIAEAFGNGTTAGGTTVALPPIGFEFVDWDGVRAGESEQQRAIR